MSDGMDRDSIANRVRCIQKHDPRDCVYCEAAHFLEEANAKYKKRIEKLEAALETLARLGNGDKYGNSDGNVIAQKALKDD